MSYTSFSALFATVRDVVIVCCLFLWILLRRQESCRCGCFCCFFYGSSGGVFYTNICSLFYQLVASCDLACTVCTTGLMFCWWRLCMIALVVGSSLNMLLEKWWASACVSWPDSKMWMTEWRHCMYSVLVTFFSLSAKFLKLNWIKLTWQAE